MSFMLGWRNHTRLALPATGAWMSESSGKQFGGVLVAVGAALAPATPAAALITVITELD